MKFPGKRTNIEFEEVFYLIEWGIYSLSNLSEMAWRARRWLSKSRDALNNEHGSKLSLNRFEGDRRSCWKSAFFGKRVPEEISETLLSPMSENNFTVDFIYITIHKILVVHVDADCARGWGLNILKKTINFVLTLCFHWLSGCKFFLVDPWRRFVVCFASFSVCF